MNAFRSSKFHVRIWWLALLCIGFLLPLSVSHAVPTVCVLTDGTDMYCVGTTETTATDPVTGAVHNFSWPEVSAHCQQVCQNSRVAGNRFGARLNCSNVSDDFANPALQSCAAFKPWCDANIGGFTCHENLAAVPARFQSVACVQRVGGVARCDDIARDDCQTVEQLIVEGKTCAQLAGQNLAALLNAPRPSAASSTPASSTPAAPVVVAPTRPNPYDTHPKWAEGAIIPKCAFTYDGCRNVEDLLQLGVNAGQFILSLLGGLTFLMFIYGGFTMVTAYGNAERFKQGTKTCVAAFIGMLIAMGAYIGVDVLLDVLGVGENFRAIK